ncbi:hypothetical protein [Vibrio sp. SCSIO 43136]|uniref:hypothetical protein n=1 Tax=Vibrio sp. SCSIO 43136 TaxID=2819101 RepID=UPI00207534B6|nr:hypothetical protein [Vibrio sp. SCSIO 43136]USD66997.1 hypothetical protein J4N39_20385 [Vibrio sp. SCSIO 43136]
MKICKLIIALLLGLSLSAQAKAINCSTEKPFSLADNHWLHQVSPELQYYVVFYLSSKTLDLCLEGEASEKTDKLGTQLEVSLGKPRLRQIEHDLLYLFDTKDAFRTLHLDISKEDFLTRLRTFKFPEAKQ